MGDLLGGALVLLVVALLGGGVAYFLAALRSDRAARATPAPLIASSSAEAGSRVTQYYRLAQRSVRSLEELLHQDKVMPILTDEQRLRLQQIVDDFYDL